MPSSPPVGRTRPVASILYCIRGRQILWRSGRVALLNLHVCGSIETERAAIACKTCLLATQFPTRTLRLMRRLVHRPRRLRRTPALRNLVRETHLSVHDFILPLFVSEKLDQRRPVASMPGVFQLPVKEVVDEADGLRISACKRSCFLEFRRVKMSRPAALTQKTE